jgi:hypothetical protein
MTQLAIDILTRQGHHHIKEYEELILVGSMYSSSKNNSIIQTSRSIDGS